MTNLCRISEAMMQPMEARQQTWTVIAAHDTPRDATTLSIFWTHVARKLRPMAEINVMAEDGSWYQKLLCLVADGADVRMHELGYWELEDTSDVNDVSDDMRVQWGGPHHLFRVVRNKDGVVLEKGFKTRADASRWMVGRVHVAA